MVESVMIEKNEAHITQHSWLADLMDPNVFSRAEELVLDLEIRSVIGKFRKRKKERKKYTIHVALLRDIQHFILIKKEEEHATIFDLNENFIASTRQIAS
ncbi:hypothetical protein ACJX0J_032752 [Zea mays]